MSAKKEVKVFEIGDRVFAKVRGYPAWPARVESTPQGSGVNTKYNVFFYGTYESAVCKRDDLFNYNAESKAKFGKQKRKGFAEALVEIETNPDIRTAEQLMALEEEAGIVPTANEGVVLVPGAQEEAENPDSSTALPEEGDEPGAPLVIDVPPPKSGKKAAAAAASSATPRSSRKRKAEESPALSTPAATRMKRESGTTPSAGFETPISSTPAEPERISRSGRVIKPKKFVDEEVTPKLPQPAAGGDATPVSAKKEDRKMWIQVKSTGDMIEINLDKDRPVNFGSKDAEIQWETSTAKNALKFKEKVENGDFIPAEIRQKLEAKTSRTPEEEAILMKEKQTSNRKEKVRWLKIEQKIIDLDLLIKQSLHYQHPEMPKCMDALNELNGLNVAPLMLKKQPDIVTTIRKLRKYVGPQSVEDPKVGEEWTAEAQKIRLLANKIYMRMQSAFAVPEGSNFWKCFEDKVVEFRNAVSNMDKNKVLSLVSDPTKNKKTN